MLESADISQPNTGTDGSVVSEPCQQTLTAYCLILQNKGKGLEWSNA
jgi:hypothetical protein